MITKFNHVGIAVKDVDKSIQFFEEKLGAQLVEKKEVPEMKQISAMMTLGNFTLEIMQGTSEDAVVSKYVASKGEGIHHLSVLMEDWDKDIDELEKKGLTIISKDPETKFGFVHPKSCKGVLLEVTQ
ncbi:MAG: VOC family protein [Desulfatiglans sp.]|jgi:methylmalonyl-CoA/ethylmalonyl-CoA epimerase|nr:VOC family protein [Thermodesulfobacteriota bacterium]MEE4354296.1 VOC family protein [Desulfatiglans sp.]